MPFLLAASCLLPLRAPVAEARILSARLVPGEAGEPGRVAIAWRVDVEEGTALERLGLILSAESELRRYWSGEVVEERIPGGCSLAGESAIALDTAGETYVEGSARIDEAWFE